jgi:hypothetical protein
VGLARGYAPRAFGLERILTGGDALTDGLRARLTTMPLAPMVAWGTGAAADRLSIGLGDLLLALLVVLGGRGLVRASFPVMTALGPLLVLEYLARRLCRGAERTTWQYVPPQRRRESNLLA